MMMMGGGGTNITWSGGWVPMLCREMGEALGGRRRVLVV